MKTKTIFIIALIVIGINLNSCKKDESTLFQGVIANKSSYTLTVKIIEVASNIETSTKTLEPNTKISNIKLEEKKYNLEAYKNDGSFYYKIVMDINGVRDDQTYDGETLDWYAEFQ